MRLANACFYLPVRQKLFVKILAMMKLMVITLLIFCVQVQAGAGAHGKKTNSHSIKKHTLQKEIKGKVTDDNGAPLANVTVLVKGSKAGTTTAADGSFTINAVKGDVLEFSMVGYKTVSLKLTDESTVAISLVVDASKLSEVVVVGYGTQKRLNLTGSVASVTSEQLLSVPVASVAQAFSGRLPGLITKQTSGKPGTPVNMSIRGFGNALFIVDGVTQSNYENIDPNEIESVSILKDASAAVYGARAGNGVVLITTKRGKSGEPKLSFSTALSWQQPTVYPKFTSSADWATIQNEAAAFAGLALPYTAQQIQTYRDGSDPFNYPNTNHYANLIKPWTLMKTGNLSLSGGSKNVNYFLSAGLMYQDGIYKSNGVNLNRYNIRSNIDVKLAKGLTVGLDASSRYTINNDVPFTSAQIFQAIGTTPNKFIGYFPDQTKIPFVGRNSVSPYIFIDPDLGGTNKTNLNYLTGALSLTYDVPSVKGLVVKVKGNYTGYNQFNKTWTIPFNTYNYDNVNKIYSVAAAGGKYALSERTDIASELTLQSSLEYERAFGKHNIKALLLNELINTKSNFFSASNDGYISGAVNQFFAGSTNPLVNGSEFQERRASFVGRINYSYKSKYLLESTTRYDGSSRFAPANRFAWFPSLSVAWRISEESFMEKVKAIDNLKLRLSASHTGYDQNAIAYQYLSTYRFNSLYVLGGTPNSTISTNGIANPDISWEDIYTYNAGLDASAWQGLISAEFDVFYRLRKGVLGTKAGVLPTTFGATLPQQNINSTDNRGFEVVLKHHNRVKDFTYNVGVNFSFSRAKYVHFDEQPFTDPVLAYQQKRTGQWVDRSLGYLTDGFFSSVADINSKGINYDGAVVPNSTIKPGMVKYIDLNNDKKIDYKDQTEIGRGTTPQVMFGTTLDFKYKGFDFSMLWQGAGKYSIAFNNNMSTIAINNVWNSYQFLFDGRWTPTNTTNAKFPATTNGGNPYNAKASDLWLRSGDYIRLKEINLGYSLPKSIMSKIKLSNARFYVAAYNLLLFDKLGAIPYDPEGVGSSWEYPLYKSVSVGLNLSL